MTFPDHLLESINKYILEDCSATLLAVLVRVQKHEPTEAVSSPKAVFRFRPFQLAVLGI